MSTVDLVFLAAFAFLVLAGWLAYLLVRDNRGENNGRGF
jgi:hypothetical protein